MNINECDRKTADIVFISGRIDITDGSTLDFKKFVEKSDTGIEKYKYGYNYRKGSDILFRYDNATDPRARALRSFPHHKHIGDEDIIESKEMTFLEVLDEIEGIVVGNQN